MATLTLPTSFGDAADRITILEIKRARLTDAAQRANVDAELAAIEGPFFAAIRDTGEFRALFAQLGEINQMLWRIEDDVRAFERKGDFGSAFVELARRVYRTNDERARVKRELNVLLGSDLVEEKSYTAEPR